MVTPGAASPRAAPAQVAPFPSRMGERLAALGHIPRSLIATTLENQRRWGCRFGEALVAEGAINAHTLANALADSTGRNFVDLGADPPDRSLSRAEDRYLFLSKLFLPWRKIGDVLVIACADPSPEIERVIAERYGPSARIAVTGKFDILWATQSLFGFALGNDAISRLDERDPIASARRVSTGPQRLAGIAVLLAIGAGFAAAPDMTAALVLLGMSLCYTANIVLRLLLFATAALTGDEVPPTPLRLASREDEAALPIYSILVPLYREANMVGSIGAAIRNLDYPGLMAQTPQA